MKLRIGSRGSKLAVAQAEWVASELKKKNSSLEISFQQITTTGDKDQSVSLQGKRVFVKEVEDALLSKQIDLAVHSLKDMPQDLPAGLVLGPFPAREDARDAFISRFGEQLNELPRGSTIGTSSSRRQAQIRHHFQKRSYRIEPMRGNVDTRLKKLHDGQYDAIVLAAAGLKRIGLEAEITHLIEPAFMLPAPAQGCLGLEVHESNTDVRALLETIKDASACATAGAERAFLQGVGGDCTVPLGAYSWIEGDILKMRAMVFDASGEKSANAEEQGPVSEPTLVGFQLAERLLYNGGSELMSQ